MTEPKEIERGDEIALSARETPMEVVEVRDHPVSKFVVVAENQHGRYSLRHHTDDTWALWVSGELEAAGEKLEVRITAKSDGGA